MNLIIIYNTLYNLPFLLNFFSPGNYFRITMLYFPNTISCSIYYSHILIFNLSLHAHDLFEIIHALTLPNGMQPNSHFFLLYSLTISDNFLSSRLVHKITARENNIFCRPPAFLNIDMQYTNFVLAYIAVYS